MHQLQLYLKIRVYGEVLRTLWTSIFSRNQLLMKAELIAALKIFSLIAALNSTP